jgi:tellurite resistance protein
MNPDAERNLKNVMVMALLDGEVADTEKQFIDSLRIRLGLDQSELNELIQRVRTEKRSLHVPRGDEADEVVRLLIEAACVDGELDDRERRVLEKVADHAGIDRKALATMIENYTTSPDELDKLEGMIDEIYEQYGQWDEATRERKLGAIADHGHSAVVPLLRVLESYRSPNGMDDATDLKTRVARRLGEIGDERAVYYLGQQIGIGEGADEITSPELRKACAEAIGKLTDRGFPPDEAGLEDAREWWRSIGLRQYNQLAY